MVCAHCGSSFVDTASWIASCGNCGAFLGMTYYPPIREASDFYNQRIKEEWFS